MPLSANTQTIKQGALKILKYAFIAIAIIGFVLFLKDITTPNSVKVKNIVDDYEIIQTKQYESLSPYRKNITKFLSGLHPTAKSFSVGSVYFSENDKSFTMFVVPLQKNAKDISYSERVDASIKSENIWRIKGMILPDGSVRVSEVNHGLKTEPKNISSERPFDWTSPSDYVWKLITGLLGIFHFDTFIKDVSSMNNAIIFSKTALNPAAVWDVNEDAVAK